MLKLLCIILCLASFGCVSLAPYVSGQFVEQTGFIKLNHPEPENYNPKLNDPLHPEYWNTQPSDWIKRCEWWLRRDLESL